MFDAKTGGDRSYRAFNKIKDEFFEKRVPDDAPEGIKEKYEKYNKLYNDACDAAMKEAWMV